MSITREQVADLREGDVVELCGPGGLTVCGPLTTYGEGSLVFGPNVNTGAWTVRTRMGDPGGLFVGWTLTVVSRAPRPLYVNHPRTKPVEHDVVRDGNGVVRHHGPISESTDPTWWSWEVERGFRWTWTSTPPQPLTLLVDGETGQVVP